MVLSWTISGLTLGSIGGSDLGSARDSIEEPSITSKTYIVLVVACSNNLGYARDSSDKGSSLTSKAIIVLGFVVILRPVKVFVGIEFKTQICEKCYTIFKLSSSPWTFSY